MELRPSWIAVAVVTCVVFGSTVQKCLTCGPKAHAAPFAVGEGTPFLAKSIEPKPKPLPEPIETVEKPKGLEDHEDLSFDKLSSYPYEVFELAQGEAPREQVPASVKALDGRKVAVRGFMLPYRNVGEGVTEFILLRNQGLCCFGVVPRMNEWIHVTMAEGTSAPLGAMDMPITVFGTLSVGEEFEWRADKEGVEHGVLMSINRMQGTHVVVPPVYR